MLDVNKIEVKLALIESKFYINNKNEFFRNEKN